MLVSSGWHTRIPQTAWRNQEKFPVSWFWRLASSRPRFWLIGFLVGALILVSIQLPSHCVLTWPLCVCTEMGEGRRLSGLLSYEDTNLRGHLIIDFQKCCYRTKTGPEDLIPYFTYQIKQRKGPFKGCQYVMLLKVFILKEERKERSKTEKTQLLSNMVGVL